MTNKNVAREYLSKSLNRLESLDIYLTKEDYSDVVRESQEIVELALKALLRNAGIEPPQWHDVGEIVGRYKERFPEYLRREIDKIKDISKKLSDDRELAFYGDEEGGRSFDELFNKQDALSAKEGATFIVEIVRKVVEETK